MPSRDQTAHHQTRLKAPTRIVNSPTNPFSVGRPIDDIVMIRKIVANTGILSRDPAVFGDQPRVPPLVDHADEQEEGAGREAVVDHLQDAAVQADAELRANIPSMTKPRWLTEE